MDELVSVVLANEVVLRTLMALLVQKGLMNLDDTEAVLVGSLEHLKRLPDGGAKPGAIEFIEQFLAKHRAGRR